ncbi:MAG: hypothetical protein VR72_11460 [Clostridiaceae bacterium BRH_c20a]|nr:MAG: hypothetical protein VR72_11460 [Clostridiaceae bacterium BRH_c20a]
MTNTQFKKLKKERGRLLDAWRTADTVQKNSILIRIIDIDEEIERYHKNYEASTKRQYIITKGSK